MDILDVKRLETIVVSTYRREKSIKETAKILEIQKEDVIHIIFASEEGKLEYLENRCFDKLPIFNFNN